MEQKTPTLDRHSLSSALRVRDARVRLALEAGNVGLWEWTVGTARSRWSPECFGLFGLAPTSGVPTVEDWLQSCVLPEDRNRPFEAKQRVLEGKQATVQTEYRVRLGTGEVRWIFMSGMLRPGSARRPRFVGMITDVTTQKQQAERFQLVIDELEHRSRNVFNLVLAIAQQTADGTDSGFVERLQGRIGALAASQQLLARTSGRATSLEHLVRAQLAHFSDLLDDRIRIAGPPVDLSAEAAQRLGMAVHELATNAGKYGALSDTRGDVEIAWSTFVACDTRQTWLEMRWVERGGPTVVAPTRTGFGSRVIGDVLQFALNADVTVEYPPEGLRWRLACPLQQVAACSS